MLLKQRAVVSDYVILYTKDQGTDGLQARFSIPWACPVQRSFAAVNNGPPRPGYMPQLHAFHSMLLSMQIPPPMLHG